jgi:phage/plasmid-associated DNA primase
MTETHSISVSEFIINEQLPYNNIVYYIGENGKKTPLNELNNKIKENIFEFDLIVSYNKKTHKDKCKFINKTRDEFYNCYSIYLKFVEKLFVVDIDEMNYDINKLPDILKILPYTKGNTKGFHLFVYINDFPIYNKYNQTKVFKFCEGDLIRTNNIWEKAKGIVYNYNNEIPNIEWNDIKELIDIDILDIQIEQDLIKQNKRDTKHNIVNNSNKDIDNIEDTVINNDIENIEKNIINNDINLIKLLLDIITPEYRDNYDDWRQIIWSIANDNKNYDFGLEFTKKSSKFVSEDYYKKIWDSSDGSYTIGTLNYYARLSNEQEYIKIKKYDSTLNFYNFTDNDYSTLLLKEIGDIFIYQKDILYVYYKRKWHENNKDLCKFVIQSFLIKFFANILNIFSEDIKHFNNINNDYEEKKLKNIILMIRSIKTICKINKIIDQFKVLLSSRLDNVEFDISLPNILCFNNVSFDLITGEKFIVEKHHYIIQTTGYDYIESTTEQLEQINNIFNDIFPDEETKKCYLSIMFSSLTGIRLEKFILANGEGRNGKGVLNELLQALLGENYSYKGNITTLTEKIKDGGNPGIANLNKMRLVIFSEPNDCDSLQIGNIKTMTGDDTINARGLYSNITICHMFATIIFECNKKPKINGRIDDSVINRFINILFPTFFTDNENDIKNIKHAKPQNKDFKEKFFKTIFKCVLFDYIINNANKSLYIPEQILKNTREYLYESDDFLTWFNENYSSNNNKKSYIFIKDILDLYKNSEYYKLLNKKQQREITEKTFKELIRTNIQLRHNFYERKKINKKEMLYIITNYSKNSKETSLINI